MVILRGLICSKELVFADEEDVEDVVLTVMAVVVVVVVGVEGQAWDTGVEARGRLPMAEAVLKSPCDGLLGSATHGELHSGWKNKNKNKGTRLIPKN